VPGSRLATYFICIVPVNRTPGHANQKRRMTHQVLARKWRPRDFESLVGQEHVVRALTHALDHQRLHHAYLLTGTRGVGKTTIARILAKAVNCEKGVSARPCGQCSACVAIDQGRFVDYLELDAASNRGVDDMTQVLENAVYSPTQGRYKVYVIDEVHMLSNHAFNAMLKTLEEPPGHALFILATTDPQKVPVTVLSRCLQFNLKNMPPARIAGHLEHILGLEGIAFDGSALPMIGQAAAGSMRDALSITDQAIAYGAGEVREASVREMLGVVDQRIVERLVTHLIAEDAAGLMQVADEMLALNVSFERALAELARAFQQAALAQAGVLNDEAAALNLQTLRALADHCSATRLQVYYQIALHGLRDLPLAFDAHGGMCMILLRLLAFRPMGGAAPLAASASGSAQPHARASANPVASARAALSPAPRAAMLRTTPAMPAQVATVEPLSPAPAPARSVAAAGQPSVARVFDGRWTELASTLPLTGMLGQFLRQSEYLKHEEDDGLVAISLRVPVRQFSEAAMVSKVQESLAAKLGKPVKLSVELGAVQATVQAADEAARQARFLQARAGIESDPNVQSLLSEFDARIVPESVRPLDE
jgi:DNA polymerase III subunit gamma/tau